MQNARCAEGQTQTVTRQSSTITIAPTQGNSIGFPYASFPLPQQEVPFFLKSACYLFLFFPCLLFEFIAFNPSCMHFVVEHQIIDMLHIYL